MAKSLISSDIFKPAQKQERPVRSYIQELTDPNRHSQQARAWLSQLSVEELEQEKVWLESLIQDKKDGK